jgi:hypothetical protein
VNRECEVVQEDLVAWVDGELSPAERACIEAHVGTCLTCRREIDRIGKLNAMIGGLPRVEPSADFEQRMFERLRAEATPPVAGRRFRPALWLAPPLAAAAALALAFFSQTQPDAPVGGTSGAPRVAERPAPEAPERERAVANAPAPAAERERQAAAGDPEPSDDAVATLSPEDLPPEVVEHPELFLRFPVVRRLDKLEHFEEVRTKPDDGEGGDVG